MEVQEMNLYDGSDFSIQLVETEYVRFENDTDPFCGISITTSDMTTSFTYDRFLHRSHLRRIITEIDNTLAERHNKDFHLQFADPRISGGECFSPISFVIHPGNTHEEDYWEFQYKSNGGYHNSEKTMSNGVKVCFEGDSIDYYNMWLEQ